MKKSGEVSVWEIEENWDYRYGVKILFPFLFIRCRSININQSNIIQANNQANIINETLQGKSTNKVLTMHNNSKFGNKTNEIIYANFTN